MVCHTSGGAVCTNFHKGEEPEIISFVWWSRWYDLLIACTSDSNWEDWIMNPVSASKKKRDFNPKKFLTTIGEGRKVVTFPNKGTIYVQGADCDALFYILKGKVRLTVVSKNGKEATIGILNPGDFFGEGGLAGQPLRMGSAAAMTDCELMRIDKKVMMLALHRQHALSDMFVAYLLKRNTRYEADLVDQLFN